MSDSLELALLVVLSLMKWLLGAKLQYCANNQALLTTFLQSRYEPSYWRWIKVLQQIFTHFLKREIEDQAFAFVYTIDFKY